MHGSLNVKLASSVLVRVFARILFSLMMTKMSRNM